MHTIGSAIHNKGDGSIALYDEHGNLYYHINTGIGNPNARVLGFTSSTVTFYNGNGWVDIYDADGNTTGGHAANM